MLRLTILDQDGKTLKPPEVASATDLVILVEQARNMIRECERLMHAKSPPKPGSQQGKVPYLT